MDITASPWAVVAALLPIFWLLLGLAVLRLKAPAVCASGLALSLLLACGLWRFAPLHAAEAVLDGAVFAVFPILWIIIAAFFTYNISLHTGADKQIKALSAGISPDARIQALIIAWGLGSFMEAVAGFGTAVVIPAAMLIALGFPPMTAAVVSLLSNTIAVAFGVVGIPMQTLVMVTDLDVIGLCKATAVQLTPLTLAVPFFIVGTVTGSLRRTLEVWPPTLAAGAVFAGVQYLISTTVGPELAAVTASLCAVLAVVGVIRVFPVKTLFVLQAAAFTPAAGRSEEIAALTISGQIKAWSPYALLFFLVLFAGMPASPVHGLLTSVKSELSLYNGPGGKPLTVYWLTTPGTLMLIGGIVGGLGQGAKPADLARIYAATLKKLCAACLTIVSIVCMAKVLSYSGMMMQLSGSLCAVAGNAYPLVSPFIGGLGSFITGSDTSANILFGGLQKEVALRLGLDPLWIAAANTAGACVGKLISPQNIALAALASGLYGQEGRLLTVGLMYSLPFLCFLGGLVYALS